MRVIWGVVGAGVAFWALCTLPGAVYLLVAGRFRSGFVEFARRLMPVAPFYAAYSLLVGWTMRVSVVRLALGNAEGIEGAERRFHVAVEPWLSHHALVGFTFYYEWAQVLVVLGVITWFALVEGPAFWRVARNALAFICAGGFLCFWLVPVAPPWALPASYGISAGGLHDLRGVGDLMGAMPSLHTAWAGWVAFVVWARFPGWPARLAIGNLIVTMVVVLTTGNHFVADVVAGELLAYTACRAASWFEVSSGSPVGCWSVDAGMRS